ncbi:MAG: 23S rRNA (adenine(2503)-C(2))-methyltransferase RlmN [Ignavibacteriaceae bacterium]|nr:23S rRNA (adenine(2503)-C(2))-methyltransferase RlmN [Ignavibacteriaceae bacterium]
MENEENLQIENTLSTEAKKKITLKGMTIEELKNYFTSKGMQKFRAEQFFYWMYNHLTTTVDEMSNIPKTIRNEVREEIELQTLNYFHTEQSESTKTKKYIFVTNDGNKIETVIIPEETRTTLCVSTQVGCPLDCQFCATGLMGYKRNLTSGEIFDQFMLAAKDFGKEKITNIVYMGMGEPLLNYYNTVKSLRIFSHEITKGISYKKITVSTAGIAPKIRELADSGLNVKIAFSLHSCFEEMRTKLMPINQKYTLKENLMALRYYAKKTATRITFEYVMLKNLNDTDKDIEALSKICKEIPSKINVIPFNSVSHMNPTGFSAQLESTSKEKIEEFVAKLRDKNITVMIRQTQGDDIAAACGQLANRLS